MIGSVGAPCTFCADYVSVSGRSASYGSVSACNWDPLTSTPSNSGTGSSACPHLPSADGSTTSIGSAALAPYWTRPSFLPSSRMGTPLRDRRAARPHRLQSLLSLLLPTAALGGAAAVAAGSDRAWRCSRQAWCSIPVPHTSGIRASLPRRLGVLKYKLR